MNENVSSNVLRGEEQELTECCDSKKEYILPRQEVLPNWDVNITFLTIGCIVSVGCKSIAFTSIDEAMLELVEYTKNPVNSKRKWEEIEYQKNKLE